MGAQEHLRFQQRRAGLWLGSSGLSVVVALEAAHAAGRRHCEPTVDGVVWLPLLGAATVRRVWQQPTVSQHGLESAGEGQQPAPERGHFLRASSRQKRLFTTTVSRPCHRNLLAGCCHLSVIIYY
jgi:hypothetical protein